MKNILSYIFISSVVFSFLALNFFSCKPAAPPKAQITVLDTAENPVEGVTVKLICTEPKCIVGDTQVTNSQGITEHSFRLPAVLKIHASTQSVVKAYNDSLDSLMVDTIVVWGEGYVTLEEDEVAKETVIISGNNPR